MFNFEAMRLKGRFIAKLQMIEKAHPTAKTQGSDNCCRSGVCCWRRPGELSPDDLDKLAAHLGLTAPETFRQFCVVDKIDGLILRLRRAHEEGGRMLTWRDTYDLDTPCVFLDRNESKCKVHEAKPANCAAYKCWTDNPVREMPVWTEGALTALGWDGFDPD